MDRQAVIGRLREHGPKLRTAGIDHLRLHGSVARGAATEGSDIDLAEFDPSKRLSLLDMIALQDRLSDLLGARVDLSPEHVWDAQIARAAERESVHAF